MPRVGLFGTLRQAAGGAAEVEIEAGNVRELLAKLVADFPAMTAQIDRGVSVSIDGKIYANAWLQPIKPDSEVFLLPRLKGG